MDEALVKAISIFVNESILKAFEPLRARIDALESRGLEYVGTFQRALGYRRGQCVTFDGSLYVCIADNTAPGAELPNGGKSWQLAVKRGQDGAQLRGAMRPGSDRGR
jgi:hypothetical protein